MSTDPLASDYASWSPYNYVLGNPSLLTDPDGRSAVCESCPKHEKFDVFRKSETEFAYNPENGSVSRVKGWFESAMDAAGDAIMTFLNSDLKGTDDGDVGEGDSGNYSGLNYYDDEGGANDSPALKNDNRGDVKMTDGSYIPGATAGGTRGKAGQSTVRKLDNLNGSGASSSSSSSGNNTSSNTTSPSASDTVYRKIEFRNKNGNTQLTQRAVGIAKKDLVNDTVKTGEYEFVGGHVSGN